MVIPPGTLRLGNLEVASRPKIGDGEVSSANS